MKAASVVCFVLFAVFAVAQNNDVAFTVGGYLPQHVNARSDNVFVIEGNIAHRISHAPKAALYLELPIVASTESKVMALAISGGQSFSTRSYSALFISPGVRLKFVPDSRLSPYFAVGGGLARFSKSGSSSTNTGVLDFGAGLDVRIARFLALRGEVRDFYSGAPELIRGLPDREHQVVATGGVVFRF
ncbi:MAG: hypothetical protein ACE14L_17710 [Terriglobales bacterium]